MIRLIGGTLHGRTVESHRLMPPTLLRIATSPRGSLGDLNVRPLGKFDAALPVESVFVYVLLRDSGPAKLGRDLVANAVYTWLQPQPSEDKLRDPVRWRFYAREVPDKVIETAQQAGRLIETQQARLLAGGVR